MARNPGFEGGLPGGGDWDPSDLHLPSQRARAAHAVSSLAIGKGVQERTGAGPRLYQGHLHYNDNDRRAMEMPMVGMPPAPKTAGLPSGLPPQMTQTQSRAPPRSAAASLASQTGGLDGLLENMKRPSTGS